MKLTLLFGFVTIPHLILYLVSKNRKIINKDVLRWAQITNSPIKEKSKNIEEYKISVILILEVIRLLLLYPEYRNLFYLRIGKASLILWYLRPLSSLYICTRSENIGGGLYIQHGFATIITAEHIGENCWINQQVTIGYNNSKKYGFGKPWIGDNVRISAGAKVCGKITIGDNSVIGVNAVVVKDLHSGSTVVPSSMQLIREFDKMVQKNF